jgi:hypothetical protein
MQRGEIMRSILLGLFSISLFATGCATSSKSTAAAKPKVDAVAAKVTAQASFDLQCPKEELLTQKLSDDAAMMGVHNGTYGVRGCGRQATYKTSCGIGMCTVFNEAQLNH